MTSDDLIDSTRAIAAAAENHDFSDILDAHMTLILPNLFLGSERDAQDVELLRRLGITHILSVMPDPPLAGEDGQFRRMNIPVQDLTDEEIMTHFQGANTFIDLARVTAKEGVLVHCQMGVSRSATIVAAYLMSSHPSTPSAPAAIRFLQARRPIVQPNWGFVDQLALYGRCDCNLENASGQVAVEAWRATRGPRWEGRIDRLRREHAESERERQRRQPDGPWVNGWRRASRWAASVFM